MLVFRIALAKYAVDLRPSGRAGRWNSNDVRMIYTSSSQSLACLENVVHRNQLGLSANFSVLSIEIPADLEIVDFDQNHLPDNWNSFEKMHLTQEIGDIWINSGRSAVMKIPSSIIQSEFNYLLNPNHKDFNKIKLIKTEPFLFDERIKG